jgi:soluble lytic murein transglycosylase
MTAPPRSSSRVRGLFFPASVALIVGVSIAIAFASQSTTTTGGRSRAQLKSAAAAGNEAELQRIESASPGTEDAALAHLMRGYLRLQARDFNTATSILADSSIAKLTALGDYATWYRAQALQGSSRVEEAEREFLRTGQLYPASILADQARRQAASSAIMRGAYDVALTYLEPLAALDDARALVLKADALEKLSRNDDAAKSLRRIYFYAPQSGEATAVPARLTSLGSSITATSAAELRARADRLYDAGQFVLSAQSYDLLWRQFPAATSNETFLKAGISNYRMGSPAAAIEVLSHVRSRTPKEQTDTLYYTGASQVVLHRTDAALQTLASLKQTASGGSRAADLLFELAKSAEKSSQPAQASSYYEQLVREFPNHESADEAHFWLAWRAHEAKDYRNSSKMLLDHVANYSGQTDNRGKAAFWAAVDADRAGEKARALTLYRALLRRYSAGWYGLNAERRIAILERAGIKAQVAEPNSTLEKAIAGLQNIVVQPETLTAAGQATVTKADQLMRIALLQPAMDELQGIRSSAPNSPLVNLRIAQVFRARNENAAAINTLKRAFPDYSQALPEEMSREVWDIFYPLAWWPNIQQEARRYSIDPYLVAGLIRQETIFNPQARSRANALGLMQLLPSTGRLVARKYSLGDGNLTPGDLYNPSLNIQLGTAYLSDMIRDFGRFEYAAAAYNGGPARVARWLRELPAAEIEEWVDSIPLSETRGYVQGVYRNARQYQRLYDEQGRFRSVVPER